MVLLLLCFFGFYIVSFGEVLDHFYYDRLDDNQKTYYDVLSMLNPGDEENTVVIDLPNSVSGYVGDRAFIGAFFAYGMDHPEDSAWLYAADAMDSKTFHCLYEYGLNFDYSEDDAVDDMYLDYLPDIESIRLVLRRRSFADDVSLAKMHKMIDYIVNSIDEDSSVEYKAGYIADVLRYWMQYDYEAVKNPYNIVGQRYVEYNGDISMSGVYFDEAVDVDLSTSLSIVNGRAICTGYAHVYKAIADRLGIPCLIVCSEVHQFNYVQLDDGCWYIVDPQIGSVFFGNDFVEESVDHKVSLPYYLDGMSGGGHLLLTDYPVLEDESFSFRYNNLISILSVVSELNNISLNN